MANLWWGDQRRARAAVANVPAHKLQAEGGGIAERAVLAPRVVTIWTRRSRLVFLIGVAALAWAVPILALLWALS